MKPIITQLEERISSVLTELIGEPAAAVVKPTQDPKFGDYQANGVMGQAKKLKTNPRELATRVVEKLDLSDICETPEIAGPGFINLRVKTEYLTASLTALLNDPDRLGVDTHPEAPVTVVDFSSPNLAKEMHVGHIRSTIIGDVIARILEFLTGKPESIIRQNHVGDWGTQFGMLVAYLKQTHPEVLDQPESFEIADLGVFYQQAKLAFDNDEAFRKQAYQETVNLHRHHDPSLKIWRAFLNESMHHCQQVYDKLGVTLGPEHTRGESAYGELLANVVSDLDKAGMLKESNGAQCVFMDKFKNRDGEIQPLIVQKSDGAFLYATTDLAAIRYRIDQLKATRIIYVTDARQIQHFDMVFTCARQAGWVPPAVSLEHVPFGSVQGEDGKPFKARSGESIKLKALLNEAVERAQSIVEDKNPDLPENEKAQIAHAVGIGAVKYADLSSNLVNDYIFSWDRMLAMEGNTAPYMQYSYARIQSIFRKGDIEQDHSSITPDNISITDPAERTLIRTLLRFNEIIETVGHDLRPHLLTTYLFDLSQNFNTFYNACPVLKSEEPLRTSRLFLCRATASVIQAGLNLLGIETLEKM